MWKFFHILIFSMFCADFIDANCVLNMKNDLTRNQPLLLRTKNSNWISLSNSEKGSVDIKWGETVRLACTSASSSKNNSFKSTDLRNNNVVLAKCKRGKDFEVNKKTYKFEDLSCEFPVEYTVVSTGKWCLGIRTELINIGFRVDKDFITEYSVCFNKKYKKTVYTKMTVSKNIDKADTSTGDEMWSSGENFFGNINMDTVYTTKSQVNIFKNILDKDFFKDNQCYLSKGKLVSNTDLIFGPEQATTAHYLNVVPQWSTCNRKNWIQIEDRVKNLAKSLNRPLTVFTGTYRKMRLPTELGFIEDMYLYQKGLFDKAIPIPLYVWKVVHDPQSRKSVAIIQINNPHITVSDIDNLVLCNDICENVNWLNFSGRKTIGDGYVYCCDLDSFESAFDLRSHLFYHFHDGILTDNNDNYNRG